MSSCLHCGKSIGPIRSRKDRDFCSNAHRERYHHVIRHALFDNLADGPPEKVERAVHVRPAPGVLITTGPSAQQEIPHCAGALTAEVAALDCAAPAQAINEFIPSIAAVRFPETVLPFARDTELGTAARMSATQSAVDGAALLKLLEDRAPAAAAISVPSKNDLVPAWQNAPATVASIRTQPSAGKDFVQDWQANVSPAMSSLPLALVWPRDAAKVAELQPVASAHFSISASTLDGMAQGERIAHAPKPVGLLSPISLRSGALSSVRSCVLYSAGSRRFRPDLNPAGIAWSMPRAFQFTLLSSARLLPDFATARTQAPLRTKPFVLTTSADAQARPHANLEWRASVEPLSRPAMLGKPTCESRFGVATAKRLEGADVRGATPGLFAGEPQPLNLAPALRRGLTDSWITPRKAGFAFNWIPVPAKTLERAAIQTSAGLFGSELGPALRWRPAICRLTAPREGGFQIRWRCALPKSLEGAPLQQVAAAIISDLEPRRLVPAPRWSISGLSLTAWNLKNLAGDQSKKSLGSIVFRFPKIVPMFVRSSLAGGVLASACLLFMSSHLQIGNMLAKGRGSIGRTIQSRAVLDYREDFHSGLSHWRGGAEWSRTWSFDKAGFIRTGQLALYKPSLEFTDYRLDFLGQIDRKGLGWVFRAEDLQNYYAVKLNVAEEGPLRRLALVRYAVIGGTESPHIEVPARVIAMNSSPAEISMTVSGNEFSVALEGQTIDTWSDDHLTSGGIGFFTEKSGRARVYHMRLSNHDDFLGRLCAVLVPVSLSGTNATRRLP